jgi:uncharacterized protein (TIGR04222 family)
MIMNEAAQTLYLSIQAYSLDAVGAHLSFSQRLARENSWSKEYSRRLMDEYKKFILLAMVSGHEVSPSDQVDQVWHLHLTYTRDYWNEFCDTVLGTPLHHCPTRGGQIEQQKYWQLYQRTLNSYERLFKEKPPLDIWPSPEQRFGLDLHFVRVNTEHYWLMPKPTWSWPKQIGQTVQVLPLLLLLSVVISGCAAVSPLLITAMAISELVWLRDFMALSANAFLGFYAGTGLALLLIAHTLNDYWSKLFQPSTPASHVRLSAEQLAYLAGGGSNRVIETALVALIERGIVQLNEDNKTFELIDSYQPQSLIEQAVIDAINNGRNDISALFAAVQHSSSDIRDNLVAQGLWVRTIHQKIGLLFIPLLLLGLARLELELTAGYSVFSLIALLTLTVVTPFMFFRNGNRTAYGDAVLEGLRKEYAYSNSQKPLCYALAVTGLSVLSDTALANMAQAIINSRKRSNSDGGGCGGGCGGGGCGGGCGGGG